VAGTTDRAIRDAVASAHHEEWGRVVATLIRLTGDWTLAEDSAAEAFALALEKWPRDGVPRTPGAWLTTTARNRAIDTLRRRAVEAGKLREWAADELTDEQVREQREVDEVEITDDRLRLIFTCCHPALALEAQVALTLRTLVGLSVAEIARALLTSEATMTKRLVRARAKIKGAGIPYRVPPAEMLPARLQAVLAVIYLLFNEGYSASEGADLVRVELSAEAIRLGRLVASLMPDEPDAQAALALMLLHDARRDARLNEGGEFVPLEDQDRSLWNSTEIADGLDHLDRARELGSSGTYFIQAQIAAAHDTAPDAASTDFARIARLYGWLAELAPSPVVELNRAIAVAIADSPAEGLEIVDRLAASGALSGYHLLPAVRADLLRRMGRGTEAAAAYREALALVGTEVERRYLERRLDEVRG
jgi:RNA polymerase sigma-70 factor (ECF subfamily)